MPAHRKIRETDIIQTVLRPSNSVSISSGTRGWSGADYSGSVSVFAGARSPGGSHVVRPLSGSHSSSSISVVEARLVDRTEDKTHWGNRTWSLVDGLYNYYSRFNPSYSTQSYDYQCLFFAGQNPNIAIARDAVSQYWMRVSSSMCLEAWVKPFTIASHLHDGHTIMSRTSLYWFGLTGSDCRLAFSSSLGMHTSSVSLSPGRWNHVTVTLGSNTGSLYVNLLHGKTFTYAATGLQISTASFDPAFCLGNVFAGPLSASAGRWEEVLAPGTTTSSGSSQRSFHGLIHDAREWKTNRTWTQISSSHDRRLSLSETSGAMNIYLPMTEGHKSGSSDFGVASGTANFVFNDTVTIGLTRYDSTPSWLPNDNPRFYVDKVIASESTDYVRPCLRVLNIPKMFYGSQIVTGSFELTCRSFSTASIELVRIIKDDGRGVLYVNNYMSSSTEQVWDEHTPWNRVGNIFYSEGVAVISDDSVLDLGQDSPNTSGEPLTMFSVSFNGVSSLPVRMISCRLGGDQAGLSLNPTFSSRENGKLKANRDDTYITSVVLYDDKKRPIGVAKLATPLRKRQGDRVNIRIRQDF